MLDILREFYTLRLDYYQRRKDYLEGMLSAESLRLDNQARFIMEKIDNVLSIGKFSFACIFVQGFREILNSSVG